MTDIFLHAGTIFVCFVLLGVWALRSTLKEGGWFSREALPGKRRYWLTILILALCSSICYTLIALHRADLI